MLISGSQVNLDVPNIAQFLNDVVRWTLQQAESELQKRAAVHLVSALVNRMADDLTPFLEGMYDVFWTEQVMNSQSPAEKRKWAVILWSWVTKALLVRNHPRAIQFSETLFQAFGDDTINWDAAKGVGMIPGHDTVLTKENHAVLRILYAQKYVKVMLPKTADGSTDDTGDH